MGCQSPRTAVGNLLKITGSGGACTPVSLGVIGVVQADANHLFRVGDGRGGPILVRRKRLARRQCRFRPASPCALRQELLDAMRNLRIGLIQIDAMAVNDRRRRGPVGLK